MARVLGQGTRSSWLRRRRLACIVLPTAVLLGGGQAVAPEPDTSSRSRSSPEDPDPVPALLEALAKGDPLLRGAAADALGDLGTDPARVVPSLLAVLSTEGLAVSGHAVVALGKLGRPAVPGLVALVQSQIRTPEPDRIRNVNRGLKAALALADIGAPAVTPLVETLRISAGSPLDPDNESLRISAPLDPRNYVNTFVALGKIGEPAVRPLVGTQQDPDLRFRLLAAIALAWVRGCLKATGTSTSEIDAAAPAAATTLAAAARAEPTEETQQLALEALGRLGPAGVPGLVSTLARPALLLTTMDILRKMGPEAADAVPAILALRARPHRREAILSLGAIGSSSAIDALVSLVQHGDKDEAAAAVEALGRLDPGLGPAAAIPGLLAILRWPPGFHSNFDRRMYALEALGVIGPAAKAAVPALIDALAVKNLASSAAQALGRIGPAAKAAIPALIDALAVKNVGSSAAWALGQIGPAAKAAVPALVTALAVQHLTFSAAEALGRINRDPRGVQALIPLLEADDDLAAETCRALERFGAAAHGAVPALERLQERRGRAPLPRGQSLPTSFHDLSPLTAALALSVIDPDRASIPVLVEHLAIFPILKGSLPSDALAVAFGRIGARAVPALEAALTGRYQLGAAQALTQLGAVAAPARRALETELTDSEPDFAEAVARALLAQDTEPDGALAAVIIGSAVRRHVADAIDERNAFAVPVVTGATGSGPAPDGPTAAQSLPRYPWPPPRFSSHDILPRAFLGTDRALLAEIRQRLEHALAAAGFKENGVFQVPGGFALVTRMERIRADGSSEPHDRWVGGKARPLDLTDYLGRLFLLRPGEFRLIAFLVTTASDLGGGAEITEAAARELFLAGARELPLRIGELKFAGHSCHVLIYHFERKHAAASLVRPSSHSTREHLAKAGLWSQLAR
jgi:HEAT repeat protein